MHTCTLTPNLFYHISLFSLIHICTCTFHTHSLSLVIFKSLTPPPLSFCIYYSSEVTLYILEQSTLGSLGRVLATNAFIHLQNQSRKVWPHIPKLHVFLFLTISIHSFLSFSFLLLNSYHFSDLKIITFSWVNHLFDLHLHLFLFSFFSLLLPFPSPLDTAGEYRSDYYISKDWVLRGRTKNVSSYTSCR